MSHLSSESLSRSFKGKTRFGERCKTSKERSEIWRLSTRKRLGGLNSKPETKMPKWSVIIGAKMTKFRGLKTIRKNFNKKLLTKRKKSRTSTDRLEILRLKSKASELTTIDKSKTSMHATSNTSKKCKEPLINSNRNKRQVMIESRQVMIESHISNV